MRFLVGVYPCLMVGWLVGWLVGFAGLLARLHDFLFVVSFECARVLIGFVRLSVCLRV